MKYLVVTLCLVVPAVTFAHPHGTLASLAEQLKDRLLLLLELRVETQEAQSETYQPSQEAQDVLGITTYTDSSAALQTNVITEISTPTQNITTVTQIDTDSFVVDDSTFDQFTNTTTISGSTSFSDTMNSLFAGVPTRTSGAGNVLGTSGFVQGVVSRASILSYELRNSDLQVFATVSASTDFERVSVVAISESSDRQYFLGTLNRIVQSGTFVVPEEIAVPFELALVYNGIVYDSEVVRTRTTTEATGI